MASGALRERVTIQRNDPPALAVSLTRSSSTATATTTVDHGYLATDYVTLAGCATGWNAKWKIVSVPTTKTFTFTVGGTLTTPTSGSVVYTSNATGGQGANGASWRTLDTVWAECIPLKAWESLQLKAIQSDMMYRFRIRSRNDVSETMRLSWTPRWPAGMSAQTLEINGVLPDPQDTLTYQILETSVVGA